MDPFLKKEWADTKIPPEIYMRARNRAWRRLHKKPISLRPWLLATASSAALLCLIFLLSRPTIEKQELHLPLPSASLPLPVRDLRDLVLRPTNPEPPAPPSQRQAALSQKPEPPLQRPEPEPSEAPRRIVLNFQLPASGVQMIWIMDSEFDLFGKDEKRIDSN